MYFIFLKTISFFVFFIMVACTNQQDKVLVEGGDPLVTSSSEEKSNKIENDDNVIIEDDLSEDMLANKVFVKKLMEVGDRVFFDYDKSIFKKEGVETLKRQARFLVKNTDITVTVEGHCDSRGTREYNLALGERRAYAVKSFLNSLGVSEDRITVISYGKEKLQSSGNDEVSWAQSRTAITVINP